MKLMETQSFTQFILSKAKGFFGTDRLENDDVCAYYVRHLMDYNKEVEIIEDIDGWCVQYSEDEESARYVVFVGTREDAVKFIESNNLKITK